MNPPIRILVADDHSVVREGICSLISNRADMEVVGQADNGVEAVAEALRLQPDVVLMDLVMPRMEGIPAIEAIKRQQPDARILVLTSFAEEGNVLAAIKAGALGYILKDSPPLALMEAIRDVYHGNMALHPGIARQLIKELESPPPLPLTESPLSGRELEVLRLVAKGMTNQEIGEELSVSPRTVGAHVGNVLSKLHLANRTQAALYALREGIASLDDD